MQRIKINAFTLIELLIVIAIIGILSALIVVGMSSTTQKATIAKAQVFSNSLRNSLMGNLVSEWKFDGSGLNDGDSATTAYTQDTWSGGNNCSINGSPKVKTGSNCVNSSCLQFNGSSDYLSCGTGVLIGSNSFTFSFWGKTSINNAMQSVIRRTASVTGWSGYFKVPAGESLNGLFEITSGTYSAGSIYRYISPTNSNLNTVDGKWHFLVGTCDRSQHRAPDVYLDGVLVNGISNGTCDLLTDDIPAGTLYIGSGSTFYYFNGSIDDVRIFNIAITIVQIQQDYFAGINKLLANNQINDQEYSERVVELTKTYAKN
ncbi:MAG: LamG-like jellyroll fold domain-containing protein [Candidatus Paceibacterota bacterium]